MSVIIVLIGIGLNWRCIDGSGSLSMIFIFLDKMELVVR